MKFDFKKKILKNGMTVLFEKRDIPVVSVAFAVKCGGINESLDEKGISHFIEHMLYKGTPTRTSKKISEEIENNGGEMNGFTSETITAYWCKMPSKHLNIALEVLSDIIKNPLFDEKEMNKERRVIFEEIKMNHDQPQRYIFSEIVKMLYDDHMAMEVLGTIKTLKSINKEKIVEKFKQVYNPDNLILCVVGDADFEKIVKFAEENFEDKKGEMQEIKIFPRNNEKIETRKGIDQANMVLAYHVPFGDDEKNYSAQLLSVLMSEGMSSRLFSEIREKRNLAYSIRGGSEISRNFGYNFIYAGATKKNVKLIKKLILKEFEKVADSLDEKELEEVKTKMIGNYQIDMEDSQVQMVNLLVYEVSKTAEEFYKFERDIKNVKLEDVKEIAKKATEEFSFFALVPE